MTITFVAPFILFGCTSASTPSGPGPSLGLQPTETVSGPPPASIEPTGLPTRTPEPSLSIPTLTPTAAPSATLSPSSHIPYRVNTIAVQSDGSIVVAGWYRVARLQPDGSPDATFASFLPEEQVEGQISAMAVQADDKILVGGKLSFYSVPLDAGGLTGLVRYNRDGSLDADFDPAIPGRGDVTELAVQADGKILVGTGTLGDPVESPGLMRLNPDGSLDPTFNVSAMPAYFVHDIALQADGKVLVRGAFDVGTQPAPDSSVVRLTRSGAPDTSFLPGTQGGGPIVVQPDGKILIGTGVANGVLRLNRDGSLDSAFRSWTEPAVRISIWAIAAQPDGKILVGGYFHSPNQPDEYFARLNPDGVPDPTFTPPEALAQLTGDSQILALAVQPDGKILVGGQFDTGTENVYLIRLNPDGSLDATFKPNPVSWTSP
jgi:uncharacterized delta-60 repeat protein